MTELFEVKYVAQSLNPKETILSTGTLQSLKANKGNEGQHIVTQNEADDFDFVLVRGDDEIPVQKLDSIRKYQAHFENGYVLHFRRREQVSD